MSAPNSHAWTREVIASDSEKRTFANCPANRRHSLAHYLGNIVPGGYTPARETRSLDLPGGQLRATELKADQGLTPESAD